MLPLVSLHRKGSDYYILCSECPLKFRDQNGKSIAQRIHEVTPTVHPLAIPVLTVPDGAKTLPFRSIFESSVAQGFPRTHPDLTRDCKLLLPSDFPAWNYSIKHGQWPLQTTIFSETPLTIEQRTLLTGVFRRLHGELFQLDFECRPLATHKESSLWTNQRNNTHLVISPRNAPESERLVKWGLEEDEDFWRSNYPRLFERPDDQTIKLLPKAFEEATNSCYVSGLPSPQNIRLYLSLYRSINLEVPLEGHVDEFWSGLKATPQELIELARRGRVRFVLPFSVNRHPRTFLLEILEAAPSSVLFPRRLSAAVVNDTRRRFPLAYPSATAAEKRAILLALHHIGQRLDKRQANQVYSYCSALSRMWTLPELEISREGVLAAVSCGVAPVISGLIRGLSGRDLSIEVSRAAFCVQIGGALGSAVFPDDSTGLRNSQLYDLCSVFLSGSRSHIATETAIELQTILSGLHCLNNDMPVLELDDCLSGSDVDRLRALAFDLAEKNQDPEMRQDAIDKLNKVVRQLERREDQIEKFDIFGNVVSVLPTVVDMQFWAISLALAATNVILKGPDVSGRIGHFFDYLRSPLIFSPPRAILVSKIRKRLQ